MDSAGNRMVREFGLERATTARVKIEFSGGIGSWLLDLFDKDGSLLIEVAFGSTVAGPFDPNVSHAVRGELDRRGLAVMRPWTESGATEYLTRIGRTR
jgi:hypothetical protein